jgi:hypothetical protein
MVRPQHIDERESQQHIGYVSIAALIVHPDRERFLVGTRRTSEDFSAGNLCFPSRRVARDESVTTTLSDVVRTQTGLEPDPLTSVYLSSIAFRRPDYPVLQLVFGTSPLMSHGITLDPREVMEALYWVTPARLKEIRKDEYADRMLEAVRIAAERCVLRIN